MPIKRTDLEKLVRQLRSILAVLEAEIEPAEVPASVQATVKRKMDAGICLAWDHQITPGETSYRGLCETDYNTTMARIRRGEENENDLMIAGKLGPRSKPGRKAAKDVATEKAKKVAEDLERYRTNKKKAKGDE